MRGSTSDVAEAFANDQDEPHQANSLYFRGNTIYSYGQHWPLAVKLDGHRVLLNQDRYGVTTSHHRSQVAGALAKAGWQIIDGTVEELKRYPVDVHRPQDELSAKAERVPHE